MVPRFKLRCAGALLLVVILSPFTEAQTTGTAPNPQTLLQSAARSIDWMDHYSSVTNVRYRARMNQGPEQLLVGSDSKVRKYRDGGRLQIVIDLIDHLSRTGEVIRRASRRETVFGQDGRTGWWYPADDPVSGSVQVAKSPPRTSKMRLVDECDSATGAFLDGNVDGLGNVIDLARAGTLSPDVQRAQIDGVDCLIVESRSKGTLVRLWIAPCKGHVLAKYVLDQSEGVAGPMHAEFQARDYQNLPNRTIARAGRSTRTWIDQNNQTKWSETVDAERVDLNLQPDFSQAGLFSTRDVPNGIRVFIDELPDVGVDFIWSNGKPIAKVDTDLFNELGSSVQQTVAGNVSTVPVAQVLGNANRASGESEQRMTEVWITLLASAALAALAAVCLSIRRRNPRALK